MSSSQKQQEGPVLDTHPPNFELSRSADTLTFRCICSYCYSLGHAAGALLGARLTGLMATVSNLKAPVEQWRVGGHPLPSMMAIERRKGKDKPVIHKALVQLEGAPFKAFAAKRGIWALEDCFR